MLLMKLNSQFDMVNMNSGKEVLCDDTVPQMSV